MCNITGSALVVITYAISVGISQAIGFGSPETLIHSYNVLLGYFGAITVICTVPYLVLQKVSPCHANMTDFCSVDLVSSCQKAPNGTTLVLSRSGRP